MNDRVEMLRNKFYVADKDVFSIPLKESTFLYNKDIIELTKIRNLFRKAEGDIEKFNIDSSKQLDFAVRPNEIASIFAHNLADTAVSLLISCEIFDLSKSDLFKSHGEIRSAMRDGIQKINKHNSVEEELALIDECKKEMYNNKGDADAIFKILGDAFKHLGRIYRNLRFDIEDILGVRDEYIDNKDKVMSILKNMESGLIPAKHLESLIVKSLQLYPFERKLYDMGYKIWGDEYAELKDLESFMMMDKNIYDVAFFGLPLDGSSTSDDSNLNKIEDASEEKPTQVVKKYLSNGGDDQSDKREYDWSDIVRLLQEKFSMQAVYYVGNNSEKAKRKLISAKKSYAKSMQKDEFPLGCYDDTLMGASDEGVLFTTLGVRIHTCHQNGDEGIFIPYAEIQRVEVRKGFLVDNVYINDVQVSSAMMGDDKNVFCNMIRFLCQIIPKVGSVPVKQSQPLQQQLDQGKRFCPNCGNKIDYDGMFCTSCGRKIR